MNKQSVVTLLLAGAISFLATAALAEQAQHGEKPLMVNETGFVICTGAGNSQPLFSKNCKSLNISRVWSVGGIKYEGTCADSNGTTFFLACDAFNFEYSRSTPQLQQTNRR